MRKALGGPGEQHDIGQSVVIKSLRGRPVSGGSYSLTAGCIGGWVDYIIPIFGLRVSVITMPFDVIHILIASICSSFTEGRNHPVLFFGAGLDAVKFSSSAMGLTMRVLVFL